MYVCSMYDLSVCMYVCMYVCSMYDLSVCMYVYMYVYFWKQVYGIIIAPGTDSLPNESTRENMNESFPTMSA